MRLIHHVSENLILNQGCSQKYNNKQKIEGNGRTYRLKWINNNTGMALIKGHKQECIFT